MRRTFKRTDPPSGTALPARPLRLIATAALAVLVAVSPVATVAARAAGLADVVPVTATRANQEDVQLFIKAGAATPVDGLANTYSFPDLKVTTEPADAKFQSITVQFTTGITAADEIYFNSAHQQNNNEALPAGFVRYNGNKHGNRSINYTQAGGATAEQWQEFLSRYLTVQLADNTNTKGLRIVASLAPVSTTRDYNSLNGHYYEVGRDSTGWSTALRRAEEHTYMGMQGYLVTVTSQAEQDFVFSLVHTDTWIGGTTDDAYTRRTGDWAQNYRTGNAGVPTRWADSRTFNGAGVVSAYYWVSGPEAGLKLGDASTGQRWYPATNPETGEQMFMLWASSQPDQSAGNEKYMQLAVDFGNSARDGRWNDLPDSTYPLPYIIEYGDMPGDKEAGDGEGGADATVDVYVKVDIVVDPTGRTITTEADDVTVGDPLRVQENVNGDTDVKTHHMDANNQEAGVTPAAVTRVYQVRDASAPGGWRDLRPDEANAEGEPFHAGTYRVTSSGVYSVDASGATIQDYVPGTATFTIRPKAVDATAPVDPDGPGGFEAQDPETGETVEVSARRWTKVYDGSPYLEGGRVSVADGTVPGASVWLEFDAAELSSADAGSRDLVLHGARLAGADAADYRLPGLSDAGDLTVRGTVTPRPLTVSSRWFSDPAASPATWVRDVALVDPDAPDTEPAHTDAAAFDAASVTGTAADGAGHTWPVAWPANMLAPGDTLEDELGGVSFSPRTSGGLALSHARPQIGTYELAFSFDRLRRGDGGTLVTPSGNYFVTLVPAPLRVTDRRTVVVTDGHPVSVTEPVKPADPSPDPVTPEDVERLVWETFGPDGPAPTGGMVPPLPDGVEPVTVIKKGGVPVEEIDPTKPGEYTVEVTYPNPDGTDYVVEVTYVVTPDPEPSGDPGAFTVTTRLEGATQGATVTPTTAYAPGADGRVTWAPGPDCYVASVELDGRAVDPASTSLDLASLSADHTVVVTLARNPVIAGSSSSGFYTVTVNTYGAGAETSPSQVLEPGGDGLVFWAAAEGYRVSAVWVDGVPLDEAAVARGSMAFASISGNHVVDVYTERADGAPSLRADDLRVTTRIEGGPGSITGGATVGVGGSYHVAWEPVVQTTPDVDAADYAVYEVSGVAVNGLPAAGPSDREIGLDNIREDKEVVVSLSPVVYRVSVQSFGPGTAAPSRTVFKGQGYRDVFGTPDAGSRITYIEVDGTVYYDERDAAAGSLVQAARFEGAGVFRQVRAMTPVFPDPSLDPREAGAAGMALDFSGIAEDHVVKVYFAKEGEDPVNPDSLAADGLVQVVPGVEGGPGTVVVGDPEDPSTPGNGIVDPTRDVAVTWDVPDGYVPVKVVVGDREFPVDPETGSAIIPAGTLRDGDRVTLVVERRAPGDDEVPSRTAPGEAPEQLRVETSLSGGIGSITAGALVDRHGSYTVEWSAAAGNRVAKVVVDGVERPDLLEAGRWTFEDVGEHHSVEVFLEKVPDPVDPPRDENGGTSTPGAPDAPAAPLPDTGGSSEPAASGDVRPVSVLPATGDAATPLPALTAAAVLVAGTALSLVRRWRG